MNNRSTQYLLSFTITLPLLLAACSGSVDVVADDQLGSRADATDDAEVPSDTWQFGHSMSEGQLLIGSIEVEVPPGEARSVCHFVPVDSASSIRLVQHEMSELPGILELVATGASATAARTLPAVFDCDVLSGELGAPFYATQESRGSVTGEAPIVELATDSAVLLRYDVANPGTEAVTAAARVIMVR